MNERTLNLALVESMVIEGDQISFHMVSGKKFIYHYTTPELAQEHYTKCKQAFLNNYTSSTKTEFITND